MTKLLTVKSKAFRTLNLYVLNRDLRLKLIHRILIATHHKTGTVWMSLIFQQICNILDMHFCQDMAENMPEKVDVFLGWNSKFDTKKMNFDYRGVHLIRDPRDVIVSGCFYHQKSNEKWLHIKDTCFGNLTYQEKINSFISLEDKLLFEMEEVGYSNLKDMQLWDYNNPKFIELKYENLVQDENLMLFHKLFTFLEFPGKSIPASLQVAYENSLFSGKVTKSKHVRSGFRNQWKKYFTPKVKKRFSVLFPGILQDLGYEMDDTWLEDV